MGTSGTFAQQRYARPVLFSLCSFLAALLLVGLVPKQAAAAGPEVGIYAGQEIVNGPGEDDRSPVELGVRFTVSTSGSIVALRFYKTSRNVGKHTGSLWSSSGARLAHVTFTNETASGWQIARLSKPVEIVAGRTYVASYHTDTGYYAQLEGHSPVAQRSETPPCAPRQGSIDTARAGIRGAPGVVRPTLSMHCSCRQAVPPRLPPPP
jgi:hypothetical protein